MPKASNTAEGGSTDLEGFDWANTGDATVSATEAAYAALEEPAAGSDNRVEYVTRENLKRLNGNLGALEDRVSAVESDLASLETSFTGHTHDTRYYTKSQSDGRYYTKSETDGKYVELTGDAMSGPLTTTTLTVSGGHAHLQGETAYLAVGNEGIGPHEIRFGNSPGDTNGLSTVFRTGPETLNIERWDETELFSWNMSGNADFKQNQVQNFVLENRSSRPSSPAVGRMIYNSSKD